MAAKKKLALQNPFAEQAERAINKMTRSSSKRKQSVQRTRPAEIGCKAGYMRRTLHVSKEQLQKLDAIAYWDRLDLKEVVEQAFAQYLQGRRVKPRPSRAA